MARSPEADLLVQIVEDPDEPDQRVSVIGDQVITATPADVGKVVTVEADGTLGLEDAAGGGWPLTADVSAAGFDISDVGTLTLHPAAPIRGTGHTPHMGSDGLVIDGPAGDSCAFEVFSGDQTKVGDWAVVAAMPYSSPGAPSAELDIQAKSSVISLNVHGGPGGGADIYFDSAAFTGRSLSLGAAGLYIDFDKIATASDLAALIAANDVMRLAGVINASTNPNYPAANAGDIYRISVAGKIGGASGITVAAGDLAMCLVDSTPAGTDAAVGGSWSVAKTDIGPLGTAAFVDTGTGAGNVLTTAQADLRYTAAALGAVAKAGDSMTGALVITPTVAGTMPLKVQAAASATVPALLVKGGATPASGGDLQQWQNAAGTVLLRIAAGGEIQGGLNVQTVGGGSGVLYAAFDGGALMSGQIGWTGFGATGDTFKVTAYAAGHVPVAVKGAASQTGALQEWRNSSGTVLASVDAAGKLTAPIVTRVGTTASSATPTPDADAHDQYNVTALAAGATFGAPTGTPANGQKLVIRVKDDGNARALAFNAIYRALGVTLPTTTVVSKTLYLGMRYNSADSKWDVLSVAQEA